MQIQEFDAKQGAKTWLIEYSRNLNKPFKVKRSEKRFYEVSCVDLACSFNFKVSLRKGKFKVKTFSEHSCTLQCNKLSTSKIEGLINPLIHDLNGSILPKNYIIHIKNEFGFDTDYTSAYRVLKKDEKVKDIADKKT